MHRADPTNFGIRPLILDLPASYDATAQGDQLAILDVREQLQAGSAVRVRNATQGTTILGRHDLTPREREVLLAGGLLNWTKEHAATQQS